MLLGVGIVLLAGAFFVDHPLAEWAKAHAIPDFANPDAKHNDAARELMFLEQYGQWVCSIAVLVAVAVFDRARGVPNALRIAAACLLTALVAYLIKDLAGRTRPDRMVDGLSGFLGPAYGFTHGSAVASFPSSHTTGAFALSAALAFFYPRARVFLYALATIVAAQRVLHHAHYLSDVIAGVLVAVTITRVTLRGVTRTGKR